MSDTEETFSDLRILLRGQGLALCATLLLAFVGMGIVFPVMPLYLRTLGATGTILGLMVAVYGLGEGIFAFVWGSLADRIGITIPLGVQMFGGGLCMVAFAFIPLLGAIFVLRFVVATLSSAIWPTGRGYLAHSVPPSSKGLAMALFGILASGGMSIGAFISGVFVDQWGFPFVFLASAVLSFVAGTIVLSQLRGARIVRGKTMGTGERATSDLAITGDDGTFTHTIVILSIIVVLISCAFTSNLTLLPLLITEVAGLAPTDVGVVFGMAGMVALVLLMPAGRLSDRVGRKLVLVSGLGLCLLAAVGLAYVRSYWPILLFAVLNSVGRWATDPPILSLLSDITPLRHQGRSQGIFVVAWDLGMIVGPVIAGMIWDRAGPQPTYLFLAAVVAICVAVTFLLETRPKSVMTN